MSLEMILTPVQQEAANSLVAHLAVSPVAVLRLIFYTMSAEVVHFQ